MDAAAKLHKCFAGDPTVMSATEVLRMATSTGARALGLEEQVGSLEPGKRADIVVVDLNGPSTTPLYHPASLLVYAADGSSVRDVMVDGRFRVRHRRLVGMDWEEIRDRLHRLGKEVAENGAAAGRRAGWTVGET
jgi:5-methylthioadenosine/S-adenosylhomocysteine deaminase